MRQSYHDFAAVHKSISDNLDAESSGPTSVWCAPKDCYPALMPTFSGDPPALSPEDLPRFHFFDEDRAVRYYHASPRAIQSFGHPRIVAAIKSVIADASPPVRGIQVDRIHAEGHVDPLAILRFPSDSAIHVLLESECDRILGNECS